MSGRKTPVTFLNVTFTSSITSLVQTFSTQASTLTTSNVLVNRGILRLSNTTGDATAFGYGMTLCNTGMKITSDQLGQISVITPGAVAEATFDTTGVGGPLMAYGAGAAIRGGYIFASAGDAMNFAPTGQVSICNAGTAQTAYSLYIGGNTAVKGSTIITNGTFQLAQSTLGRAIMNSTILSLSTSQFDLSNTTMNMQDGFFTQSNTSLGYHDLYSTSLRVFNAPLLQSNLAQQTAQFYCTNMSIYTGDFLISSTTTTQRTATLNGTNLIVNSGNTTLRSTLTMSNSAGTIAANLYSTNLTMFGGNFTQSNRATGTATFASTNMILNNGSFTMCNNTTQNADFFSTNMTIRNANFTMSNTASVTATATFYSTQVTILNGGFIQSNTTGALATALFYSTAMTVHGPISTTETLYCLGRFNSPNVGNISTLILGNNIESTAKVSLDVRGTYRTQVQQFSTNADIQVNGGNIIYASTGDNVVLYLPETDGAEIGVNFTMHSESPGNIYLSTLGADYINTAGTRQFTITKQRGLTSILCLGSGAWHAITSA